VSSHTSATFKTLLISLNKDFQLPLACRTLESAIIAFHFIGIGD
jgi:hypothetical protein